ncbi:hypothetical protein MTO96_022245 [Rhipicephalus appendiculatus]
MNRRKTYWQRKCLPCSTLPGADSIILEATLRTGLRASGADASLRFPDRENKTLVNKIRTKKTGTIAGRTTAQPVSTQEWQRATAENKGRTFLGGRVTSGLHAELLHKGLHRDRKQRCSIYCQLQPAACTATSGRLPPSAARRSYYEPTLGLRVRMSARTLAWICCALV